MFDYRWKAQIGGDTQSKPARAGLFPTPCATPTGSLPAIASTGRKAVAIQTQLLGVTAKERQRLG